MDKDDALEAVRAVERGEAPSGSVIIALTGKNSLSSPGPDKPEPHGHHIEERAIVYLKLSEDGKRWEIDSPSNDGSPLFGYDNGPGHEECPECPNWDAGNALARDVGMNVMLPTLPELHKMIGEYLYPTGRSNES